MTDLLRAYEESMSAGTGSAVDAVQRRRASCPGDDSTKAGG